MKRFLYVYFSSLTFFLTVDLIWIVYIAGPFYRSKLNNIIMDDFRIVPALIFYALFVLGMVVLVIYPSMNQTAGILLGRAALFGLICYATYDLTNYATIENWSLSVLYLDIAWGASISSAVSYFGYRLAHYF